MKRIKNKIPMCLLIFATYLWLALLIQDLHDIFIKFSIVVLILFIVNLIVPFFQKKNNPLGKEYAIIAMIGKLVLIPIFCFIFLCGFALAVVPGFIILVPILIIVDYALLLATSIYEIFALASAYRAKLISKTALAINVILSLLFCFDVFSSIYVFAKIKKGEKLQGGKIEKNL